MHERWAVSLAKQAALEQRMKNVQLHESDCLEKFITCSGPGGQHVNKTATGVYLKHLPTGLEVKAQKYRSQHLNRYEARKMMVEKLELLMHGKLSSTEQKRAKIAKQKKRRARRHKIQND